MPQSATISACRFAIVHDCPLQLFRAAWKWRTPASPRGLAFELSERKAYPRPNSEDAREAEPKCVAFSMLPALRRFPQNASPEQSSQSIDLMVTPHRSRKIPPELIRE